MKAAAILLACLLLIAVSVAGSVWVGWFNVAAINPPSRLEVALLHGAMVRSVRAHAAVVEMPQNLAERAGAGAADFDEMCVQCHGAPGREPGEVGAGLNPRPPDLAHAADRWSPAEIFWIIKNGVRMTGMPAFGPTHDDDRIWSMVAFVRQLPGMTPDRYEKLTAAAADGGDTDHHHSGTGHHQH
jgi:mono/diheme cytochrome c family protein